MRNFQPPSRETLSYSVNFTSLSVNLVLLLDISNLEGVTALRNSRLGDLCSEWQKGWLVFRPSPYPADQGKKTFPRCIQLPLDLSKDLTSSWASGITLENLECGTPCGIEGTQLTREVRHGFGQRLLTSSGNFKIACIQKKKKNPIPTLLHMHEVKTQAKPKKQDWLYNWRIYIIYIILNSPI